VERYHSMGATVFGAADHGAIGFILQTAQLTNKTHAVGGNVDGEDMRFLVLHSWNVMIRRG
jgi:hypothetical protein